MNILQVVPELDLGGVETGTVDMALSLAKLGHKSVVASSGGELAGTLQKAAVTHYSLDVRTKSPILMLRNIRVLYNIIKKEKIDLVHARSRVPAWPAFFAARLARVPFITTCHGYYSRHLFSFVMGWGKLVIVPSNVIGRRQIKDFGVPFNRVRYIPRSVDIEKFKFKSPREKDRLEPIVGIIGRISPIKGHIYFLRAMAKVARHIPHIKIWIIGDAGRGKEAYKEEIDVFIKRLGLSANVEFLGKQRDIPHILNQLNLIVVPTVGEEAFGRVIIEAQAAGVPVVASRVGGIVDIIEDGVNGLLVPPRDPQAVADKAVQILRDTNLAVALAASGRKSVEDKFTLTQMVGATIKVYEEAMSKNILVIKLSAIGDVILSTPALRAIRAEFPKAKIACLTSKECGEILLRSPYIDELIIADFKFKDKGIKGLLKLAKNLRERALDLCVDLQNNRKSHLLSFLSLAPDRYGYDNKKFSFLLNHKAALPKGDISPVEHQAKILEALGIAAYGKKLELWPQDDDRKYIDDLLNSEWIKPAQKLVGINISASRRWGSKLWPVKNVLRLNDLLASEDMRLVITGEERDLSLAQDIFQHAKVKPVIACGKTTLNQLACLIKRCSVYISGDSAPLHIASSMNTPFIALFGPTEPSRHLPPSDKFTLIRKHLPCSPCYKPECPESKGRFARFLSWRKGGSFEPAMCMLSIAPEEVFAAVKKLLLFYSDAVKS